MRSEPQAFLAAIAPYREDLVVGAECIFCWYWLADLCAREGIRFVLGHLRKIVALAQIYGAEATARALEDGLAFVAFSCEYIANLLEARARHRPEASPLSLTRAQDLLEIEIPQPDLSLYESHDDPPENAS